MNISDIVLPNLKGIFTLRVIDKNNNIVQYYDDPNLVVAGSKEIIATLLGGTGGALTKVGLGTGTAEATIDDTALTSPAYYSFTSVEYPDTSTVKYNWYVGYDQLVGTAITEFGLLTENNKLFCRRVYPAINKNADLAFTGAWSIRLYTA